MKKISIIKLGLLLLAVLVISVTGCNKNSSTTQPTSNTTSLQNQSNDETQVTKASDEANNDINTILSGQGALKSIESLPCNATLDSTTAFHDTITYYITYNGLNCDGNLFRTGRVEIKKHVHTEWHKAGATINFKYINYHIYHVIHPEKAITINGSKTYENVTGGLLFMLGTTKNSITHKEWGYMVITFENGTTRSWNIARQLTYTRFDHKLILTTEGFGNADGYTNLVIWGVNRDSEQFYDQILQPNVFKQKCEWDGCAGQRKMMIPSDNKGATITWGYDSNNQPTTGNECPTKYKVDWYNNGQSGTMYLWLP